MAYELPQFKLPGLKVASSADLSSEQYFVLKLVSEGEVDLAASSDIPIGVLQNTPDGDETAEVAATGITKMVAGSTIAAGKQVGVNANGEAEEFSETAGEYMVGISYTSAGSSGEIISAGVNFLNPVLNELSSV